jgi:hypothetical protein
MKGRCLGLFYDTVSIICTAEELKETSVTEADLRADSDFGAL